MKARSLVSAVTLLLLAVALADAADAPAPPKGRFRGDIVDPVKQDVIMKVALQAPQTLPARRSLTLLFLCHGFQGNENNYIGLTVEALKRLKLDDQFVVVSGKSKGPGWTTADDEAVLRMIDWAIANYPIDPRRVFLFGSSNGAAFVGRFGSQHPERFAGVVGYCGSYKFDADKLKVDNAAETRTEWYFVHGSKDNPQNSRKACEQLKAAGVRHIFRQMDGYGHTDIWDSRGQVDSKAADAVRDDWLRWMHALRHKEMPLSAADQKTLAAAPTKEVLREAALIGGPAASKVVQAGLQSADAEVRAAAAGVLEHTRADGAATAALIKLLAETKADAAFSNAAKSLAVLANWRDAGAQRALSAFALDAKKDPAQRLIVVQHLAPVVRLPFLGNFEDGRPFWTLVRLLDDPDEKVRAVAIDALKAGKGDDLGYRAGADVGERKAAVEKWQAWCKEKCGDCPADLHKD